jgi:thioredoxin-related protein
MIGTLSGTGSHAGGHRGGASEEVDRSKGQRNPQRPLAAKYGVKAVPTLLLFEFGEMRSQLVGNVPKVEIEQFLRANGVSD